jgi:hypothetical protein
MNTSPDQPSPYKMLSLMYQATGTQLRLRMFDRVLQVKIEENTASALVETHDFKELSREYRLTRRGRRLISFQRTEVEHVLETGGKFSYYRWSLLPSVEVWDEDFEETIIAKYGTHRSVRESYEKAQFERDCYRPGTVRSPMDNAQAADSPRMMKHWRLV